MTQKDYMSQENTEEENSQHCGLRRCINRRIENYIKNSKERLITADSNSIVNIRTSRKTTNTRKQIERKPYGCFKQQTNEIAYEKHLDIATK